MGYSGLIISISFRCVQNHCNEFFYREVSKFACSTSTLFVLIEDRYILNGSYVNDTLLLNITPNQDLIKTYDILQLVSMIQWFLLYYIGIYKCKLVVVPMLLHTQLILYPPRGIYLDHSEKKKLAKYSSATPTGSFTCFWLTKKNSSPITIYLMIVFFCWNHIKLTVSLIWFCWVLWHTKYCWLFNTKSCLYTYIMYIICKYILYIALLNESKLIF